MINGENVFDQPIKNNKVTYENIRKIATVQGDDYTTDCLLDYSYFADTYKMIAVDLSKQQALDADLVANHLSTDIKLSKTQLSKMIQSGGFLGRLLGPLLKTGLPLMKSVIKPLAKSVLLPLGLTTAASAAEAGIHKKNIRIWSTKQYNLNNVK